MNRITLFLLLLACSATGCQRSTDRTLAQASTADQSGTDNAGIHTESKPSEAPTTTGDARLQTYFERYCDYTGSMGIGFVASHTYDYKFRQHLKSTNDQELKRLFVLWHLYREVDFEMDDYEEGQIRIGKVEYRQMTVEEKASAKKDILEKLDDLETFDPDDPEREIAEQRAKLN